MNPYYFLIEAEPQRENPVIAHASRGVAHIWVMADALDDAREKVMQFLATKLWDIIEEKEATLLSQEEIDAMSQEKISDVQTARTEGIHAKFYYWHRSE